jgi:hypothetical protein
MMSDLKTETTTTTSVANTVGGGQVFRRSFPTRLKDFIEKYGEDEDEQKNESDSLNEASFSKLYYELTNES